MGKYGRDDDGRPYVHIKAWKQDKLIVEVIQTDGELRVRCRRCKRWHTITIHGKVPVNVRMESLPASMHVE